MDEISWIFFGVAGFSAGLLLAYIFKAKLAANKLKIADMEAAKIIEDAERSAETLLKESELEAKDRLLKMKSDFDAETRETRSELKNQERRIVRKIEGFDKKQESLESREKEILKREKQLDLRESELHNNETKCADQMLEQKKQLEKISGLTSEQAKDLLIHAMENEARHEGARLIKRIESESKELADKNAKKILATAIQRYSGDFVAERTVSVVPLPSDEMKGRIIGREGRNIRALEAATGIDLIIDDTPEAVILSGFNPVRREVARLSLLKLIADGRIHPARIEDIVKSVTEEVDLTIKEAGEQATFDVGVHGINPELIKVLGRLKFRT
ncbi:MAG: DUF3552 domain-containing protein, partial [Deltaproteobacteria bacterium]